MVIVHGKPKTVLSCKRYTHFARPRVPAGEPSLRLPCGCGIEKKEDMVVSHGKPKTVLSYNRYTHFAGS